jgi:hypothetical protein
VEALRLLALQLCQRGEEDEAAVQLAALGHRSESGCHWRVVLAAAPCL